MAGVTLERVTKRYRDVVAAVSNVGGLGVLGAVGFGAKQLETELAWIDERVGDKPYGVDIVLPNRYEGKGEDASSDELEAKLRELIPEEHRAFVKQILADGNITIYGDASAVDGAMGADPDESYGTTIVLRGEIIADAWTADEPIEEAFSRIYSETRAELGRRTKDVLRMAGL